MFNHDLRSFSLNLLYLIFSILTWTGWPPLPYLPDESG